jgi:hypothetical protein
MALIVPRVKGMLDKIQELRAFLGCSEQAAHLIDVNPLCHAKEPLALEGVFLKMMFRV